MRRGTRGFTLIVLLVMAILATLLALAAPRYFESVERAKEAALHMDLRLFREAIGKHRADTGRLASNTRDTATMCVGERGTLPV